jgi:hypothetical protein
MGILQEAPKGYLITATTEYTLRISPYISEASVLSKNIPKVLLTVLQQALSAAYTTS